jgi:hypothetical protein
LLACRPMISTPCGAVFSLETTFDGPSLQMPESIFLRVLDSSHCCHGGHGHGRCFAALPCRLLTLGCWLWVVTDVCRPVVQMVVLCWTDTWPSCFLSDGGFVVVSVVVGWSLLCHLGVLGGSSPSWLCFFVVVSDHACSPSTTSLAVVHFFLQVQFFGWLSGQLG